MVLQLTKRLCLCVRAHLLFSHPLSPSFFSGRDNNQSCPSPPRFFFPFLLPRWKYEAKQILLRTTATHREREREKTAVKNFSTNKHRTDKKKVFKGFREFHGSLPLPLLLFIMKPFSRRRRIVGVNRWRRMLPPLSLPLLSGLSGCFELSGHEKEITNECAQSPTSPHPFSHTGFSNFRKNNLFLLLLMLALRSS